MSLLMFTSSSGKKMPDKPSELNKTNAAEFVESYEESLMYNRKVSEDHFRSPEINCMTIAYMETQTGFFFCLNCGWPQGDNWLTEQDNISFSLGPHGEGATTRARYFINSTVTERNPENFPRKGFQTATMIN
jgi:hypothetical protein